MTAGWIGTKQTYRLRYTMKMYIGLQTGVKTKQLLSLASWSTRF